MAKLQSKYRFKFSIIMSIYNVEDYLEEAIESVVTQCIGFEKNVELILVNDGSPDNSGTICEKYAKLYPNNVQYIEKENGGLSSARNAGLKHVKGEIVNFLDPDDTLSINALDEVYRFYKKNELFINQVFIPIYFFETKTGLHKKYRYMGEKNRIISLTKEPWNFVLTVAAGFYSVESIAGMNFEDMRGGEDSKFNLSLYMENQNFGYVCERNVQYNYRQRVTKNSIIDTVDKKFEFDVVKLFDCLPQGSLLEYQQEMIIYELRSRIGNFALVALKNHEKLQLEQLYQKYIYRLETNFLLTKSRYCDSFAKKVLFLALKENCTYAEAVWNYFDFLHDKLPIHIMDANIEHGSLILKVIYNSYGCDWLDVFLLDSKNRVYTAKKTYVIDTPYNVTYGSYELSQTCLCEFELSTKKNKSLRFAFYDGERNRFYKPGNIKVGDRSKFASQNGDVPLIVGSKAVSFNGKRLRITTRKSTYLKHLIKTMSVLQKETPNKNLPYERILSRRKKQYLLFNDRPDLAGDNAEALFRHICTYRKDLKQKTYFVLQKNSPDYKRLKKYGKVVVHGSLKHKILFLNAAYIFSSHNFPEFIYPWNRDHLKIYNDLLNYKFVFLQHGVSKDNVSRALNKYRTLADVFVTSTKKEYESIRAESYMYFDDEVKLTGLPRFDLLHDHPKNTILLCPTWRNTLTGRILSTGGGHEKTPGFMSSDYYLKYCSLLTNKKLRLLLKRNNLKLKVLLHPGMAEYINEFRTLESDEVLILPTVGNSYSELFAEAKLLITDYSSVFFDIAYLRKPMIFFQFDEEEFFATHYERGYFSYRNDGFGDVLNTVEDVVNKIAFYIESDFDIEAKYLNRINETIPYQDSNNCQRVLSAAGL